MEKRNVIFKLILFVFGAFLSVLIFSHLSTPVFADNLNCASHIFYENVGGAVFCIKNADSKSDNAVNTTTIGLAGTSFGYMTQVMTAGGFSGFTYPLYGAVNLSRPDMSPQMPLKGYNLNRECKDSGDVNPGNQECSNIINSVVTDPSDYRIGSLNASAVLACVTEHVQLSGEQDQIVICNQAVDQICSDDSYLRAAYFTNTAILGTDVIRFWCDQVTGTSDRGATVTGSAIPSKSPPSLNSTINPLGYCYTSPDGFNLNDGTQILVNKNAMIYTNDGTPSDSGSYQGENLQEISSHFTNGYCVLPGSISIPKNTINCQVSTYYSTHQAECNCISYYNAYSNTRLANGNTYTALGCISGNLGDVVNTFLSIAIGIAGVIALLMMIVGGYEIMTNPAGPDEIKEGQQYIVNAILGLLLIIFTVVVLRIIGVDILGINELAKLLGA